MWFAEERVEVTIPSACLSAIIYAANAADGVAQDIPPDVAMNNYFDGATAAAVCDAKIRQLREENRLYVLTDDEEQAS